MSSARDRGDLGRIGHVRDLGGSAWTGIVPASQVGMPLRLADTGIGVLVAIPKVHAISFDFRNSFAF